MVLTLTRIYISKIIMLTIFKKILYNKNLKFIDLKKNTKFFFSKQLLKSNQSPKRSEHLINNIFVDNICDLNWIFEPQSEHGEDFESVKNAFKKSCSIDLKKCIMFSLKKSEPHQKNWNSQNNANFIIRNYLYEWFILISISSFKPIKVFVIIKLTSVKIWTFEFYE